MTRRERSRTRIGWSARSCALAAIRWMILPSVSRMFAPPIRIAHPITAKQMTSWSVTAAVRRQRKICGKRSFTSDHYSTKCWEVRMKNLNEPRKKDEDIGQDDRQD